MGKDSSSFNQDHFRLIAAFILIILGIYLIFRSTPLSGEFTHYFFPGIMLLGGCYWLTEFFLTERDGVLVPGLLFTVLGLFLILSRWQILPALSSSWPLLLACVGGVLWIHALMERSPTWPMILLVIVGIGLYITTKPWFSLAKMFSYWPILIVIVGLSLIFRPHPKKTEHTLNNTEPEEVLDSTEDIEKTD